MRRQFFGFFVLCCFCGKAQNNIQIVLANMQEQEKSWNNGDIPAFMKHYWQNDSLRFIGKKGVTYGWQNTLNNYLKSYPDKAAMGILHFKIEYSKELSQDHIYIIGKWELEKDKPVAGYFTLLWQKIQGKWVIVADHTS